MPALKILDPDRHQPMWFPVLGRHDGRPVLLREPSAEVCDRAQRHDPIGPPQGILPGQDDIVTRKPVPHIELDRVTGVHQLSADPLGPQPVLTGITDVEIQPFPWIGLLALRHAVRLPPQTVVWLLNRHFSSHVGHYDQLRRASAILAMRWSYSATETCRKSA